MEATKQTKMTKEDLHLSWKDKLNIIRDNRYFLMLFPIVMLAVMILIFGVATAGRFFKLSVMKGILSQAIIIGTCATGVAFIYSNGNLDISIGAVLGLAATLGVKAYSVTQSVVVMILATVAVALGLMAFNCTMSVVCNIKTITVAIVVTQIYGAISTLLIGGSGKIDLDMSVAAMLEETAASVTLHSSGTLSSAWSFTTLPVLAVSCGSWAATKTAPHRPASPTLAQPTSVS